MILRHYYAIITIITPTLRHCFVTLRLPRLITDYGAAVHCRFLVFASLFFFVTPAAACRLPYATTLRFRH